MPTIAAHTLGCKVNQYDTEAMLELFEGAGYRIVPFDAEADIYLVNTCTVTGTGDSKSLKLIRRLGREHPKARLIVTGCMAQRDPASLNLPGVCLIVGTRERGRVVSLYEEAAASGKTRCAVSSLKNAPFENLRVTRHEGKTRAVMKIQEGCDRFCSYCIIPAVRGGVRSMPLEQVRAEAERLAQSGYRELVVTGIHLASYGRELGADLVDALKVIHGVDGVERIRLGSLEPLTVDDRFIEALDRMPKLCPQFHVALQSGCDTVLKRMKRRYDTAQYTDAVTRLRRALPRCAVTTDVLTGFPGETDEEAEATLRFVEKIAFARIHVFPYSRRKGTVADLLPDQVPEPVKKRRCEQLIRLGNKLECDYVSKTVGTVRKVLFENASEGFTPEYVRVSAQGEAGRILPVLITSAEGTLARGRVLDRTAQLKGAFDAHGGLPVL
ncbi:MAG: tRNA (N(6)-L-threonylcarbamoyladenosine(37)-C(2))-methylthiotransferase MtaB [Clostridia bacterium]|nr:tRNA (N(6)-L-threonylcarbamoyladenosine(37)-C(2))-methylthiotransferase MtaB [Clostridia bacterium]